MKHVFIVHSNTAYLSALGTINLKQLNHKDIIIVTGRNQKCYMLDNDITLFDLSHIYDFKLRQNSRARIIFQLQQLRTFIDENINDTFVTYTPHLNYYFFQTFATHPNCKSIKFIQEGIIDFCKPENIKEKVNLRLLYINKYLLICTWAWCSDRWNTYKKLKGNKVDETFALSKNLFKSMPCIHSIIKWPHMNIEQRFPNDATFFVFESAVEQNTIELDIYIRACYKLIKKHASNMNYVKFHPYQSSIIKEKILNIFNEYNLAVSILPGDIPFELLLCRENKLKVCGFTTSLIFYASLLGHETHICVNALLKSKSFQNYWNIFRRQLECYGNVFNYENV